MQLIKKKDN